MIFNKLTWASLFTAALSLPLCSQAALEEHRVKVLPGWNEELPSKVYAGYIDAGKKDENILHEHYMFIEAENDPANSPFVVWTNGGPGAASFFGLLVELGPYLFNGDSVLTEDYKKTGVPTLFRNPYSWTKFANILILNSPVPVGYSYCDPAGDSGDGYSCGDWNDEQTSYHNRIFLENWLKAFPEYTKHDIYITGESYAGIYVPTLVRELLDHSETFPVEQLKGFAVGDGCVGTDINCGTQTGPYFEVEFLHGHGQFSLKLYAEIQKTCTKNELYYGIKNPECQTLIDRMNKQAGYYFEYNLYDECWYDNSMQDPTAEEGSARRKLPAVNDYICGGQRVLSEWLVHPKVKEALHVSPSAKYFTGDNGVGFNYEMTEKNLLPFYKRAIEDTNLRVLVYNGDTDPGLNSIMAETWTSGLEIPEKEEWRPWTLDGKGEVVGYVTRYENDFDFLTIRGSGHMVPQFKPAAAYEFMSKWIANDEYKPYVPPKVQEKQVEVEQKEVQIEEIEAEVEEKVDQVEQDQSTIAVKRLRREKDVAVEA